MKPSRTAHALLLTLAMLGCRGEHETPAASARPAPSSGAARSGAAAPAGEDAGRDGGDDDAAALPAPAQPPVDLLGVAHLPPPPSPEAPKVGATSWVTRVHRRPSRDAALLGMLRGGAVVAARAETAGPSSGCAGGWRGIEPAGFACADELTSDPSHATVQAASRRPDFTGRLPYMYGTVTRGGPVYARIPTAADLKKFERSLSKHLQKWRDDEESGARYGLDVWLRYHTGAAPPDALTALAERVTDPDIPAFLRAGATVPNLSGLLKEPGQVKVGQVDRRQGRSFIYSLLFEGRRYNVTPDLLVIPADRFRPIRGSSFHGWAIAHEAVSPPFAIVCRKDARKWLSRGSERRLVDGGPAEHRSLALLTGKQRFQDDILHYETKEGFWLDDRHASRIDPARRWPKWAQDGGKWIDINLTKQVLVAYEGMKMVYATVISSGEAGLDDAETTTATLRGIFRIHTKLVTTTMDSDEVGEQFELRDVPYVQYFKEGYAIHGAYWHDGFGRPKSHGCINLAPEDARRLFFWTDPPVPAGWHAALRPLTGTIVFIHA